MKKFLKLIPIFLAAIVLAVFFVPGLIPKNTTTAESNTETIVETFEQSAHLVNSVNGKIFVSLATNSHLIRSTFDSATYDTDTTKNKFLMIDNKGQIREFETLYSINDVAYFNGKYYFASSRGLYISDLYSTEFEYIDIAKPFVSIACSQDRIMAITKGAEIYTSINGNDFSIIFERSNVTPSNTTPVVIVAQTIINIDSDFFIYATTVSGTNFGRILRLSKNDNFKVPTNKADFGIACSFADIISGTENDLYGIINKGITKLNTSSDNYATGTELTLTETVEDRNIIGFRSFENIYFFVSQEQSQQVLYKQENNVLTKINQNIFLDMILPIPIVSDPNNIFYFTKGDNCTNLTKYIIHDNLTVNFVNWNDELIDSQSVEYGSHATEPSTTPTRPGYTFSGWDKDPSKTIIYENTTFVAQYVANKFNVYFNDISGNPIKTIQVTYGETINSEDIPTAPQLEGYVFTGWDKDLTAPIVGETSFFAQYSRNALLTINYMQPGSNFGLLNQFTSMKQVSKTFTYTVGDIIKNDEFNTFLSNLKYWENDFSSDGKYDYQYKFCGWDKSFPDRITENLIISVKAEKLNLVRLVYYSQLRFKIEDDYFYTFISEMNIERLLETGAKINVNDFKRADVDYEIYNANRDTFYNNLVGFNFKGWDYDITKPISSDLIVKGIYDLPKFEIRYYDADLYLIETTNNQIDFMGIENLIELLNRDNTYLKQYKHFFRSGIIINVAAINKSIEKLMEKLDVATYIQSLQKYNDKSTRLITPFVVIDSDRPDAYGGIFTSGKIEVDSAVLTPFAGDLQDHDRSYYISPIMFTTSAYPMSATVTFTNKLHSAIKSFNMFFSAIGSFFKAAWKWMWKILIIAGIIALICFVLYLFKEPLRRTIDNANKKRIEQKQENQRTKQQLKQSKQNNNHFKSKNFKSTKRKK